MPLVRNVQLTGEILDLESAEMKPARDGYGEGLLELGEKDKRVVALCADLTESTRTEAFAKKFPERFIEMGVISIALLTGRVVGGIVFVLTSLPSRFAGTAVSFLEYGREYRKVSACYAS